MTDDENTPEDRPTGSVDDFDDLGGGDSADPTVRSARRRRRLIAAGVGAAALVLVLLICGGGAVLVTSVHRLSATADEARSGHSRVAVACLELEKRLNRLAPPGAAGEPAQRATAIRNENLAVQPLLPEIQQLRGGGWRDDGPDAHDEDDGPGRRAVGPDVWAQSWQRLIDARAEYAAALDNQAATGVPAFFLPPQDSHGRPVLDRLTHGPGTCAGPLRRLASPDL